MKVSAGTVARTIVLLVALTNQILVSAGKSPLPFEDESITECVTLIFTFSASMVAWWKNNSFTSAAIEADAYKNQLIESEE